MSIVSYDLLKGEEPFLSYTWPRSEGPPLLRTGKGPPAMHVIDGSPDARTTHPEGLRLGTWLLLDTDEQRERNERELAAALATVDPGSNDGAVVQRAIDELPALWSHARVFRERMAEYALLGMQGCGDLTMNDWKVAYISGTMSEDRRPNVIALPSERIDLRRYTALLKWKKPGRRPHLSIQEVRFSRRTDVDNPDNLLWVRHDETWHACGNDVEFAVASQQVIRDGEIVSAGATCHQFGDLRHLLRLPNLNPDKPLHQREQAKPLPRRYFGKEQYGSIWLGESTLIEGRHNLVRAALSGPITIPVPPDCIDVVLRGALAEAGYEEELSGTAPLIPGRWRVTDLVAEDNTIDIYFHRNTYSWGMIGLTKDNTKLLAMAADAVPGKSGHTLEEAAGKFREAGAWNALLVDEGFDVFHLARETAEQAFDGPYQPRRSRLRAVFLFGKQRMAVNAGEGR
jgi:hypothetical protein